MVIDFVDNHQLFQNQYKKRCIYYKSKNYLIENYITPHNYYEEKLEIINKKNKKNDKNDKEIKCLITL
jgi:hypothetical protein